MIPKKKKTITKEQLEAYIIAVEEWLAELKASTAVLAADSENPPPSPPPNPPR